MPQTQRYSNVQTQSPQKITFDTADPRYKLARKVDIDTGRTGRTGSYGSGSPFSDPRRMSGSTNNQYRGTGSGFGRGSWNWSGDGVKEASQRSTNKAVTVEARTVEGSTRQTLGNRARVTVSNAVDRVGKGISAAKNAASSAGGKVSSAASSNGVSSAVSSAASAVGKIAKGVSRTVSSSASGGVSVGAYKGGIGVGISRGGVDLGVGFASISYNFSNPNESSIGGFFNTATITGTQEGCTIFLDYKFLGKKYFTETRQADKCEKPEPGTDHKDTSSVGGELPAPEPTPPPGSETTRTTTTTTTMYNFAETHFLWSMYSSFGGKGRDAYFFDRGNNTREPVDPSYSNINPLTLDLINYAWGTVRGEIGIRETIYRTRIPFWTNPDYQKIGINITGSLYAEFVDYHYVNAQGQPLVRIGSSYDNRVEYGNYETPDNYIFTITSGRGDVRFLNNPLQSYDPSLPNTNPINDYPIVFFHNRRIVKTEFSLRPVPNILNVPSYTKPRGVKEPVDSRQQILLERVYQMLGGDRFWEEGLAVPNELFTPEPDGNSTQAKTYNEINNILFRTIDHRTPAQVKFPLANGAEYTSVNAPGYFADLGKNVSELLEKANNPSKSDNSEVMGYLHRVSLLNTQAFNLLVKINELVKGIIGFLGIPMRETVEQVDIPFDPTLKGKLAKGFGKPEDLDKELEKLLKEENISEEKSKETVARYASSGKIPVRVKKLRQSSEGGDFWWLLRNGLNLKK